MKIAHTALIAILAGLTGCVLSEPPRNSRYFGDYTGFEKVDFKHDTNVYRHPTTRVIDYDKFLISPVIVYDNPQKKIKDSQRGPYNDLAEELRLKLVTLVSRDYKVVDEPGPGVLRLEYAVVDIKSNVWYTKQDGNRAFRRDTMMKGSKFELDCVDSQSDELIFAISTLYPGDEYLAYEDSSLIPNIQTAFNEWARFLSGLLERAKDSRKDQASVDRQAFRPSTSSYVADPDNAAILIYRHPFLEATDYKQFYFAQPLLQDNVKRTPDELKDLRLKLRAESTKVFDDPNMLINHPGPGILTIRTKIEQASPGYKFQLECIDPFKGDLVFGLIWPLPQTDLFAAYKKWNSYLNERWDNAKENAK